MCHSARVGEEKNVSALPQPDWRSRQASFGEPGEGQSNWNSDGEPVRARDSSIPQQWVGHWNAGNGGGSSPARTGFRVTTRPHAGIDGVPVGFVLQRVVSNQLFELCEIDGSCIECVVNTPPFPLERGRQTQMGEGFNDWCCHHRVNDLE